MARREFTYNEELPVYRAIAAVARERQISFQQAIHLILVEWYSLRNGEPLTGESIWGATAAPIPGAIPPPVGSAAVESAGAAALADEWM